MAVNGLEGRVVVRRDGGGGKQQKHRATAREDTGSKQDDEDSGPSESESYNRETITVRGRRTASTPPAPARRSIRQGRVASGSDDNDKGTTTKLPTNGELDATNQILSLLRSIQNEQRQTTQKLQATERELQQLKKEHSKTTVELSKTYAELTKKVETSINGVEAKVQTSITGLGKVESSITRLEEKVRVVQGSVEALSGGSFPKQPGPPSREISNSPLLEGDWPRLPIASPPQSSNVTLSTTTRWLLQDVEKSIAINTARVKKDISNPSVTVKKLNEALKAHQETAHAKIQWVKALQNKWVLTFDTEEQMKAARQHRRWLEATLPGARILDETWYPVKLDHVQKSEVAAEGLNTSSIRPDLQEKFIMENPIPGVSYEVKKVAWISKASNKTSGSMIMWLSKKEAANFFLQTNAAILGTTRAGISKYVASPHPERCYNCNKYGHRQADCKQTTACGICAQEHQTRDCTNTQQPKCAACGELHQVTFKGCQTLVAQKAAMTETARGGDKQRTMPTSACQ